MNRLLSKCAESIKLKKVPLWMIRLVERRIDLLGMRAAKWIAKDPYAQCPDESTYETAYPFRLGIVKELWHDHWPYIQACREMGVAYRLVDLARPDWIRRVEESGCQAFLVWPSVELSIWKQMFDERLKVMSEQLGKILYPSADELWFHESKRRMHYRLASRKVPHPKTWVFYDEKEALEFVEQSALPIVYKSDLGSGASGVRIFRDRSALRKHVQRCFRKGFTTYRRCGNDKEWGSILLQEFLPEVQEWRVRRVGDSYFGSQKLRAGDFHSGTGIDVWYDPPPRLLDFAREITEANGFRCMCLDIFETTDGRYLVNELQSVFGTALPYEMMVNGVPGRYLYDGATGAWRFEEGIFCQNGCCNLRVADLARRLGEDIALPRVDMRSMIQEGDVEASQRDYAEQAARRGGGVAGDLLDVSRG
jgi:hypothetical protein